MSEEHEVPVSEALNRHLLAIAESDDPEAVIPAYREHLWKELIDAGMRPSQIRGLDPVFLAHALGIANALKENRELLEGLKRVHSGSARRLGRVTGVMDDVGVEGEALVRIWIDNRDAIGLPEEAERPSVGDLVEWARGADGDAAYFGSTSVGAHVGLISGEVKSTEVDADGSVIVEVIERQQGDTEETVWALASEELRDTTAGLEPGAPVRVTPHEPRMAYPAASYAEADEDETDHPLFRVIDPIPAEEDEVVYHPEFTRQCDHLAKIISDPDRAAEHGLERPNLVALTGPTGVAKTTGAERYLARTMVALGYRVVSVNSEELTSYWYGQSEKLMARAMEVGGDQNTVIIIDEIDSNLPKRGLGSGVSSDVASRTFASFVNHLKQGGPGEPHRLVVLTTNYYERLDAAIRSRVDVRIEFPLPDAEMAARIATVYLQKLPSVPDPEGTARAVIQALDFPLIRLVFEGSEAERVHRANEVIPGRAIKQAAQAAGRAAFFDDAPVCAHTLLRELKRQLHSIYSDLGREDMGVALGLRRAEVSEVSAFSVAEAELVGTARPSAREQRMRFRLVG